MQEKFKELYEKASDAFFALSKKFDGVNEYIYEHTQVKVNVGAYIIGVILLIITVFFVKAVLGFIWGLLTG